LVAEVARIADLSKTATAVEVAPLFAALAPRLAALLTEVKAFVARAEA
jgi:hypothetical protein